MMNLSINARNAGSDIMISWKWYLSDLSKIPQNGYKVFSCFSCGGGSTMGYKLAGFDVLGNVEIDEKINKIYVANHNPKYNYNMDIRDFNKLEKYPDELYDIDILDGSPPCTSFSMAGNREADWGKEKQFAEGGKLQTLDDLFFDFIRTAEILKPKIIVAENVTGLIKGNAKGYCNLIIQQLKTIGYDVQMFLLNSATMGVPQSRERVFFIAKRNDLGVPNLILQFDEKPVKFGEVRSEKGVEVSSHRQELLKHMRKTDKRLLDISMRIRNKYSQFNTRIVHDSDICYTVMTKGDFIRGYDKTEFSISDIINVSSFPQDYDFRVNASSGKPEHGVHKDSKVSFICGMSVPPLMMNRIAEQVKLQWLEKL